MLPLREETTGENMNILTKQYIYWVEVSINVPFFGVRSLRDGCFFLVMEGSEE